MSGAFSEHMLKSYESKPPFDDTSQPQLATYGPMSFNPQMHGTFSSQPLYSFDQSQPLYQSLSDESTLKLHRLQTKLNQKLGPEYVSQRPSGGGKVPYLEGWKVINLANEIFGFNGWNSSVLNITTDFLDCVGEARYNMGVTATVRVTLRDGAFHEDCGTGSMENAKTKVMALEKCKKEAVTDALKRALRHFGNVLGNCLYDKSFTNEVIKIKVQPPKFDKSELHRRPEFEEPKPIPSTSTATPSPAVKSEPRPKPISSVPPHMRPQVSAPRTPQARPQSSHSTSTPPPPYNHAPNRPAQNTAQQNASIQRQPPQPQPQSHPNSKPVPQKVTFAEPTVDADESFASDDDAFLAVVDLGEGDMGKPIDYDEGVGGVSIDRSASDLSVSNETSSGSMGPPAGVGVESAARGNPPHGQLQGQQQQQSRQPSNPTSNPPTSHPQNQNQNVHRQPSISTRGPQQGAPQQPIAPRTNADSINSSHQHLNQNSNGTSSRTISMQQQHNGQTKPTSSSSDQNKGIRNPGPVQNQNQPPGRINGHSHQGSTTTKPQSMGSFVFPAGVDPQSLSPHPPAPRVSGPASAGTFNPNGTFSLKRSADAMNGPSSNTRKPGMGLAQQHQVERRPLGNLEMGEGGDVKRPRY